jgi:hypothetical protein
MKTTHTILYLTDNSFNPDLASFVRRKLVEAAGGRRIISVSQKPIAFGDNICVGEIGRSWHSLYSQLLAGVSAADTEYIAIAEHDCLYTPEHFAFVPPRHDTFYYNKNCWFVQWGGNYPELNGMYSFWPRSRLGTWSQMIVSRGRLLEYASLHMRVFDENCELPPRRPDEKRKDFIQRRRRKAIRIVKSGDFKQFSRFTRDYIEKEKESYFKTKAPNLDIRHDTNFSGPRRGHRRRYELPYWGRFEDVLSG